jgi:hypothetical protein
MIGALVRKLQANFGFQGTQASGAALAGLRP